MAYDAYRPKRSNEEPGYFGASVSHMPESSSQYNYSEPRELREHRLSSTLRQSNKDNMTSAPDRTQSDPEVSPELIAAITERVKKELVEHLKQTGSIDDPKAAPPLQRAPSNKSSSTSSPPPTARGVYTPPSPTQPARPINIAAPPAEPVRSPPSSPLEKPSGVRFSDRSLPARPTGGSRTYSTVQLSAVDEKWGRLFDHEGNPTQRLGQFLRGLANHMIEDLSPKKSIVVTPSKMATFYASHALDKEIHPLLSIFRAQSNEQISTLYQDLGCQHHLVQDQSSEAPVIPALTPIGFAHWMTIHLLAYPDQESKRLENVVLAMPIDADGAIIDGKPERLPKQISRHLLPEKEDRRSRKLVENAINNFFNDLGTSSRRKASITSPSLSRHSSTSHSRSRPVEIHQTRTSPTTSKAQPIERERNPYSGPSASESSGNEESVKIERDRQPYTALPGNGKRYNENTGLNAHPRISRANSTSSRTKNLPEQTESRHHRTQSTASQNYVPPPRASGRRPSSPPIRGFSISTPDDIGGSRHVPPSSTSATSAQSHPLGPSSYSSSSSIPPHPPANTRDSRDSRARDYGKTFTDEEAKLTGGFISPRDAERWDKFQESQAAEPNRSDKSYENRTSISGDLRDRASISIDPRDTRGAAYEDWYREPSNSRGAGYDGHTRY